MPSGNAKESSDEQPKKADEPILSTVFGITIDCKDEHPEKHSSFILVIPSGNTIDARESQP
jgi:hypothetical protein